MSADGARKQRRKAAAKNREKGMLQGAAEAEAAVMGEMVTRGLRSAARGGGAVMEATVAVEVVAEAAMRESGTPEEMVEAAIVKQ